MTPVRQALAASLVAVLSSSTPTTSEEAAAKMSPIERILRSDERFAPLVADAAQNCLQVVLGLIEEDQDGDLRLVQHGFRAGAEYYYPASAIKLYAAVAALEALDALAEATGLAIDESTPLVYHPLFPGETLEDSDPSNLGGGRITVGHDVRKVFLVSDNEAYNRLYELAGPAAINRSMHRAGLSTVRIVHRLSERRTPEENLMLPRIGLSGDGFRHELPRRTDPEQPAGEPIAGLDVGRGYLEGGKLIERPMNFSDKNRTSLADLQRALCKVVRPEVDAGGAGFRLSDRHRALLNTAMRQFPRQSGNPVYDPEEYPDAYVKLLLPGLLRVLPKERFAISNKVGQAYGFTIENAWVEDSADGRGFFLAAVVYANPDGVLNDDRYGYQQVAEPFLADLGEAVARALWNLPAAPRP